MGKKERCGSGASTQNAQCKQTGPAVVHSRETLQAWVGLQHAVMPVLVGGCSSWRTSCGGAFPVCVD
jgi:hypothetical protein